MEVARNYLSKYSQLTPPQATRTRLVVEVIQDECGITLPIQHIEIRRGGVVLTCHPTVRCELMRHVPTVLEVLHKKHNLRLAFIR